MKKVLILSYEFPPYVSVGGFRPYSWYKYFHEFDIFPIIVTRQWANKYGNQLDYVAESASPQCLYETSENGIIIRAPYFPTLANRILLKYGKLKYSFLRRFISLYYEVIQFIFPVGPKSQIYFAAENYLKNNSVDCIIATGDPFVLFKYASILSKKYNTRWIADYRDPWSQDFSIKRKIIFKLWCSYLEKKYVASAYLIITVSEFCKHYISSIIKNKIIYISPNGYDLEVMEGIRNIKQENEIFSLTFTGTINNFHPIRNFISVISRFISDNKNIKLKLNFYGINIAAELEKIISLEFPNIKKNVTFYPKMPNETLLQKITKDNIMILFNSHFHMGTKIYDYLGIKRTILLCYSNDPDANKLREKHYNIEKLPNLSDHLQEELIIETNSGYIVKNAEHLYTLLGQLYEEFSKNGSIQCNSINTEKYSRKNQAKILADIIKNTDNKN